MTEFEEIGGIPQAWVRDVPHFHDHRGYFSEEFRKSSAPKATPDFIQDSLSYSIESRAVALRGDPRCITTLKRSREAAEWLE